MSKFDRVLFWAYQAIAFVFCAYMTYGLFQMQW
jgi:hypothetical protein